MLALDRIKLLLATAIGLGSIGVFIYLDGTPLVVKLLAMIFGFSIAIGVAWTSEPGKRFYSYTQDSVAETRKVVWPTKKETVQTTGLVVLFVIVMAIFLWLVDGVLVTIVKYLLGTDN
tara:strand:- start:810 stop:1163 length:354 start_codon:yes stop_codon:yes gene_type:complete